MEVQWKGNALVRSRADVARLGEHSRRGNKSPRLQPAVEPRSSGASPGPPGTDEKKEDQLATQIDIGAKIIALDGRAGDCRAVVIDPGARRVTHVIVTDRRDTQHLVPVGFITEGTADHIELACRKVDVEGTEPLLQVVPADEDYEALAAPPLDMPIFYWPYASAHTRHVKERIPKGEVAIGHDTAVEGLDHRIGQVDGVVVNLADNHIASMIVRTRRFPPQVVAVAVSELAEIGDHTVKLKLSRHEVKALPQVSFDQLERLPWLDTRDRVLIPERPSEAGVEEQQPDSAHREAAHVLAAEAQARLSARGFTSDQILEWAEAYLRAEGTGEVDGLIGWIEEQERTEIRRSQR
jgi:hypothetical protein